MRWKTLVWGTLPLVGIMLTGCRSHQGGVSWDPSERMGSVNVDLHSLASENGGQFTLPDQTGSPGKPSLSVVDNGTGYQNKDWNSSGLTQHTVRATGGRGADADYIDKADVYWKLNWIRKELQSGNLPSNLKEAVAKTRKGLMTLVPDRNRTTAEDAVAAMEEGVQHQEADKALKAAGLNPLLIPFAAGREAVARYFDRDKKTAPVDSDKYKPRAMGLLSLDLRDNRLPVAAISRRPSPGSLTSSLSSDLKSAQAIAISYAERYHASPEEMMRRAWRAAIEKTNKLRDDLGLMNRAPNSDRNDVEIPSILGTRPAEEKTVTDDDANDITDNVVPIPAIGDNAKRVDVPASVYKEPAEPFAERKP